MRPSETSGDWSLLLRLWRFARPDTCAFAVALIVTPVVALANLAQPWLLKIAIDEHIVAGTLDGLDLIAWQYLGAVVAAYFLQGVYTLALSWGGTRTLVRLRGYLFAYLLSRPQSFFDRRPAGMLLTRLTSDVDSLGEALHAGTVTIVLDLLMIIGVVAAMFALHAELTIVMLIMSPILFVALDLIRRRLKRLYLEIRSAISAVNTFLAERIDGVQIVQLYSDESRTLANFDTRNRRFRDACSTANVYDAFMFALVDGMGSIFVAAMLLYGGNELINFGLNISPKQAVSAGLLMAFIDYLNRLFSPLRELSGKISVLQRAVAALTKIFGLLESEERPIGGNQVLGSVVGHVEIDDVRFRYRPEGPEVLRGVSLTVRPGEVVAVVGASGSGKTTLARLLDKSYDGYTGSIRLDGQELSDLAPHELRAHVAEVRQDIHIFSNTVGFNVDLNNPNITADMRNECAEMVNAKGFVERLGWSHILRERGADLSVGEGQLLTFARTMAHDPEVIILDEATASVDSLTEALIQQAIERILSTKTVIVIAHRLSTIQAADRIAVMESGCIVEQGNHQELLALGGRYAQLIQSSRDVSGFA